MVNRNISQFRSLAKEFELYERRSDETLLYLNRRKPVMPSEQLATMIHVQKKAAAAVVVSPHDFITCSDPEDIPIGMQVRKKVVRDANTTGGTLECPGGAFLSDQELKRIAETTGMNVKSAPGDLFYQLLYEHLMDSEEQPKFTYTQSERSMAKLIHNVRIEVMQEMGAEAAKKVRIVRKLNRAPRFTDLTTISFGDDKNADLVKRYGDQYDLKIEQGKSGTQVSGFVTRVAEDATWADVDSVEDVARSTKPTEEADGMYVYTVGELLALFELSTKGDSLDERAESWEQFVVKHPKLMRPRAPSTAWQIRMLFEYLDNEMKSQVGTQEKMLEYALES